MTFTHLIYMCIVNVLETILIGKYIFERQSRKASWCCLAVLLTWAVCYLEYRTDIPELIAELSQSVVLMIVYYKQTENKLLRYIFLSFLGIVTVESLLWSMVYLFPSVDLTELRTDAVVLGSGCVGILFWIWLVLAKKKYKWKMGTFFRNLSSKDACLFSVSMLIIQFLFGCIQGFYLEEMNATLKRVAVAFCILVVVMMVAVFMYLGNVVQKKHYLEEIQRMNQEFWQVQKQYFEQSKARYEQLKAFRHDVREHFQILQLLIDQEQYKKADDYIGRIQQGKILKTIEYTGNVVSDALIQDVFGRYMGQDDWHFSFNGKMPEQIPLDEMDLCILLSNAFRNAKEAMENCETKDFCMTAGQTASEICIIIENSVNSTAIDVEKTQKDDKSVHGYGVANMKKVIESYDGEISWKLVNARMVVRIYIPFNPK